MELYVNTRLTSSQSIKTTNSNKELSKTIPRGAFFLISSRKAVQCRSFLSSCLTGVAHTLHPVHKTGSVALSCPTKI